MPTDPAFRIRPAEPHDVPAIVRLWIDMMAEHTQFDPRVRLSAVASEAYAGYLEYHRKSDDSLCLVAELPDGLSIEDPQDKTRIAAYCLAFLSHNPPMFEPTTFGFISDLAVARPFRRQGIGAALMDRVEKWMRGKGVGAIQLQVYSRNQPGAAFWKARRFTPYYNRMWLDLAES